jgi:hypothetical protein
MKMLADLSDWLLNHGMVAADLRSSDLGRFLRNRRAAGHTRYASFKAVRPVLDYLQRLEVMPPQTEDAVLGPVEVVRDRFWRYLDSLSFGISTSALVAKAQATLVADCQ